MTTNHFKHLIAGAACAGLMASAGAAFAQAAAAPRPAGPPPGAPGAPGAIVPSGPVIPGVCVFYNDQVIATSAVGKYVGQRWGQLRAQAAAEVGAEQTALETEAKTLEGQRASISTDVYQQRALSLNQRAEALQRKADLRNRELQATREKALGRVVTEVNPLLSTVYGQRNCGLLLDRNIVFGFNPSMDVTADVVKLLDAKIQQFPFDRERLDQQPAAGAPPAAAPPRQQ